MLVQRPPEFYFFDTSHPPKLRSALVVLADQIWTQTLMTAVIAVPNSAIITEVIRFPLECFFPRHFYVSETIVMVGHVVWIWRDRDTILWQMSFLSGEDLVNHPCIHPTVREVLWFAPFIPTYVSITLLVRNQPWLFWNIFWWICTPVLRRLAALVGFFIATNTWAFFAGERRVRIVQGVMATVVDIMHSKVLKTCCRAPRPLVYLLFWLFDFIQDGIELFRRRTSQAAILTSRPPKNSEFCRYRHFPLADAKRQIRLLRLHGGLGNVQGTLINVPLDTAMSYEAISWAWDTPAEQGTNTLLIEGMELGISPNMYRILSLLVPIRSNRLLWIDAICIDQTSRAEKQDQIPLMTEIYASAERVVAFPGEGPLADLAAESIGDLDLHLATRFSPQMFPHVDRSDHFPYRDRQKAWTAFFQLVQLRFWTRAWIIQELVVAKSVVIRHGRSEIPFDLLGRVVQAFKAPIQGVIALSADDILVYSGDYEAGRYGLDFIGRLHFLRQMYHLDANAVAIPMPGPTRDVQRKAMPAFPDLLVECVQSEATMPHDKVWALCGIVRNAYGKLDFLQPNYALPKTKIYADTARHVLRTGGTRQFALFGIAGDNKPHDPSSPSWVPDLAQTPQLYPIDNAICPYRRPLRTLLCHHLQPRRRPTLSHRLLPRHSPPRRQQQPARPRPRPPPQPLRLLPRSRRRAHGKISGLAPRHPPHDRHPQRRPSQWGNHPPRARAPRADPRQRRHQRPHLRGDSLRPRRVCERGHVLAVFGPHGGDEVGWPVGGGDPVEDAARGAVDLAGDVGAAVCGQ